MACADVDMDIHGSDEEPFRADRVELLTKFYQAKSMIQRAETPMHGAETPMHGLFQKPTAVLGSLQMISGLLSVGIGIIIAVTLDIGVSLCALFRVSYLTGILFVFAGVISNLLFKYPGLLQASLVVNSSCIVIAVSAACLISIDLHNWHPMNDQLMKLELLELCVLGLEVLLSAVLCFWVSKEKHSQSSSC